MSHPAGEWRVEVRRHGRRAWALATAERFLTTARAWREARTWEDLGFEVQVVRETEHGLEVLA